MFAELSIQQTNKNRISYIAAASVCVLSMCVILLIIVSCRHHLFQHGQGGKEGGRLSRSSVRRQMEKLKLTYAEKADEEENVDQLLHWTKNLDGTVLSTPHSLTTPL